VSAKYKDQLRTCVDCRRNFLWTADDQEYFHEKGFITPPKRCQECRRANREERGDRERGNRR
jgi:hypothetical protein